MPHNSINIINSLFPKNLLGLNPRSKPYASVVPSSQTKQNKQHWKRNIHSKCDVSTIIAHYENYDELFFFSSSTRTKRILRCKTLF